MQVEITEIADDRITFMNIHSPFPKEETHVLEEQVKGFGKLGKAELNVNPTTDKICFIRMQTAGKKEDSDKKGKASWADDLTTFEDLLDDAHKKFKDRIEIKTELLEDREGRILLNYEEKKAVFKATVIIRNKEDNLLQQIFEAHGDSQGIDDEHFIRKAETRAIARALRWATNNAKVPSLDKPAKKK